MNKIYIKYVLTLFGFITAGFLAWWAAAGLENARNMLFVITVLASCISVKFTINEVEQRTRQQFLSEKEN